MSARRLIPALALAAAIAAPASAQTFQSEVARDVRAVGEKFVALAQAMPADSYDWSPADGVRSVSEVFMHIAGANIGLPANLIGASMPAGYSPEWLGGAEGITDKAEVVSHVETAFAHMADAIEGLSDAQLNEPVNVFGRETNVMGAVLLLQTHSHEHLGQSIAYARTNGVVPPWSN